MQIVYKYIGQSADFVPAEFVVLENGTIVVTIDNDTEIVLNKLVSKELASAVLRVK